MYQWKAGSVHRVDPQVAGTELDRIALEYGSITDEVVLNESRPVTAPLHSEFEWDDKLAAERYRLEQAQDIIRSVVVKIRGTEDERPVRAFVHVLLGEAKGPCYVRTIDAMGDADLRKQVLTRAWKELQDWQRRYQEYEELASIFQALREVKPELVPVG